MIRKIKKSAAFAFPAAFALIYPFAVFAQDIVPESLKANTEIVPIIRAIIRFIVIVAFVLAFIFLLIGGIRWITAGGDEKGVAAARGMITSALIGLVIVLVAFAIIKLVETFFGVPIISNPIDIESIGTQAP